jgi:hypothetical protein
MGDEHHQETTPGIGELGRKIEDFRRDVRDDFAALIARLDQLVPREVYNVERDATSARIKRLEDDHAAARTRAEEDARAARELAASEASETKRANRATKITSVAAVVASVAAALVSGWLSKGGH